MKKKSTEKGFTLIELMTSLSIFAIIVTVSLGSILGIFSTNRKTRSLKALVSNLNSATEELSKEMRYGSKYHCGSGSVTTPQNCSGGTLISFLSSSDEQITYRLNGSTFEKQVTTSGDWIPVIAPEVVIDSLSFYTFGATAGDGLQPKTVIKIQAHSGTGAGRSDLSLQTLVSERAPDS